MSSDDISDPPSKKQDDAAGAVETVRAAHDPTHSEDDLVEQIPDEAIEILEEAGLDVADPGLRRATLGLISFSRSKFISGPLPSGEEMQRYKDVDPALPGRIFDDAQQRRDHRQGLETITVKGEDRRLDRAQAGGWILGIGSIVAAVALDLFGGSRFLSITIVVCGIGGPNAATVLARYLDRFGGSRE